MDLDCSVFAHQTAFVLRLAKHVASGIGGKGNVAISPVSIYAALALLAAGAKGKMLNEIVSVIVGPNGTAADLHALATKIITCVLANGAGVDDPVVSCASGVFVDASLILKPSFKEVVTDEYESETKALDFRNKADEVRQSINSWVEKATSGLIRGLLLPGSVDKGTSLVLVNALYFKGVWSAKFDPSETKDSEFHLLDGTSVQAPFMTTGKYQFVSSYDGFKVLKLVYMGNWATYDDVCDDVNSTNLDDKRRFSMYIFLPDARDGIWSMLERMTAEPEFFFYHTPIRLVPVGEFKLPKFAISCGFDASAALKDLGMSSAFNAADSDFSEMVKCSSGLCVNAVAHKSFLQVDEFGTESSAATDILIAEGFRRRGTALRPLEPVDFVADHPFIFFITELYARVHLFAGLVTNPLLR